MSAADIRSFADCRSAEERKQRPMVILLSVVLWIGIAILTLLSMGLLLLIIGLSLLMRYILAEYHVRRIQALGATVSEDQFPTVHAAAKEVFQRFGVNHPVRIVVIASGEVNAMSLRLARKRVVILLSELLAGVIDQPEELRGLIAHEACHLELDFGWQGLLECYKPPRYRQARELTCDNASYIAAGTLESTKTLVKKVCAGRFLYGRLSERSLVAEARFIYSGFFGWLVRRHLSHPPAGARLENIAAFAQAHS